MIISTHAIKAGTCSFLISHQSNYTLSIYTITACYNVFKVSGI